MDRAELDTWRFDVGSADIGLWGVRWNEELPLGRVFQFRVSLAVNLIRRYA